MHPAPYDRRTFLQQASLAGLALSLGTLPAAPAQTAAPAGRRKIAIFSKTLQWAELDRMADMVAECGFDGLDLTVRPRGHVEPARVKDDLPRFAEAMKKVGKEIVMLTTAIGSADDPYAQDILETAGKLGIGFYRTTWYRYTKDKSIEDTLKESVEKLKGLARLNEAHGIKAGYQNHAGVSVGSPVWDLGMVLRQVNSPWIGCQYDIRHAMVEGGTSWTLGFDYLSSFMNTFIFKDYYWRKETTGEWKPYNVTLGQGMVDFDAYYAKIKTLPAGIPGTLHMEFDLGGAELGRRDANITPDQMIKAMKANMAVINRLLAS